MCIRDSYKGNYYQVLGISRHSETLETLVVYQALYGNYGLWVRPIELFKWTLVEEGQTLPRFKYIGETVSKIPELR